MKGEPGGGGERNLHGSVGGDFDLVLERKLLPLLGVEDPGLGCGS